MTRADWAGLIFCSAAGDGGHLRGVDDDHAVGVGLDEVGGERLVGPDAKSAKERAGIDLAVGASTMQGYRERVVAGLVFGGQYPDRSGVAIVKKLYARRKPDAVQEVCVQLYPAAFVDRDADIAVVQARGRGGELHPVSFRFGHTRIGPPFCSTLAAAVFALAAAVMIFARFPPRQPYRSV